MKQAFQPATQKDFEQTFKPYDASGRFYFVDGYFPPPTPATGSDVIESSLLIANRLVSGRPGWWVLVVAIVSFLMPIALRSKASSLACGKENPKFFPSHGGFLTYVS